MGTLFLQALVQIVVHLAVEAILRMWPLLQQGIKEVAVHLAWAAVLRGCPM